jgi:hypothetical protein
MFFWHLALLLNAMCCRTALDMHSASSRMHCNHYSAALIAFPMTSSSESDPDAQNHNDSSGLMPFSSQYRLYRWKKDTPSMMLFSESSSVKNSMELVTVKMTCRPLKAGKRC